MAEPLRYALIGGVASTGLPGLPEAKGMRTHLAMIQDVLAHRLAPEHRVERAELLDTASSFEASRLFRALAPRVKADPEQHLWVVLAGEVVECLNELCLVTCDHREYEPGLPLRRLCQVLAAVLAQRLVVVLDVHRAEPGQLPDGLRRPTLEEIAALPWPGASLLAIGPGVAERLPAALVDGEGARSAGAVLGALDAAKGHATTAVLNVASRERRLPGAEQADEGTRVREYLEVLQQRASRLAFEVRDPEGREPGLDDVYIPSHARRFRDPEAEREPSRPAGKSRRRGGGGPGEQKEPPPPTLHDAIAKHDRLFVVGGPGSGKTTFLRKIATEAATARLYTLAPPGGLPEQPFPVLVSLEDYGRDCRSRNVEPGATDLRDFALGGLLAADAEKLDPAIARRALSDKRLVLLLDGLDEVPETVRRDRVAGAIAALADSVKGAVIVVTCRPAAARDACDLPHPFVRYDVSAFDDEQRAVFVHKWMTHRHGDGPMRSVAREQAGRLLDELRGNAGLASEVESPLILTIVCMLFHKEGMLPESRAELYDQVVTLLLDNRRRGCEAWPGPAKDVDRTTRRRAMEALAWGHRTEVPAGGLDKALLFEERAVDLMKNVVPERRVALDLLLFLQERTGLLDWRASSGTEKQYAFPHRTLTEFLAASHAASRDDGRVTGDLLDRAKDADWREVLLLYTAFVACRPGRSPEPAWALVRTLARAALDDAKGGRPERAAVRGRLAAECLKGARASQPPEDVLGLVDRDLQDVFADPEGSRELPELDRIGFWAAVGTNDRRLLGERWTRIPAGEGWRGQVPGDTEAYDDEKPGRLVRTNQVWVLRWSVLVSEYAAFIDAGGYDEIAWWDAAGRQWSDRESVRCPKQWGVQKVRGGGYPVVGVSYWEARAFCAFANEYLREAWAIPDEYVLRLPTEAEWERAARWDPGRPDTHEPDQRVYPWGKVPPDPTRANFRGGKSGGASPVGAYPAGTSGGHLFDMAGNVWEWCLDAWSDRAYHAVPPDDPVTVEDGRAPLSLVDAPRDVLGAARMRVVRGGGFGFGSQFLRVSYRLREVPVIQWWNLGFRCVAAPRILVP